MLDEDGSCSSCVSGCLIVMSKKSKRKGVSMQRTRRAFLLNPPETLSVILFPFLFFYFSYFSSSADHVTNLRRRICTPIMHTCTPPNIMHLSIYVKYNEDAFYPGTLIVDLDPICARASFIVVKDRDTLQPSC